MLRYLTIYIIHVNKFYKSTARLNAWDLKHPYEVFKELTGINMDVLTGYALITWIQAR